MTLAAEAAPIAAAAGPYVGPLMDRIETRLEEIAASRGEVLAGHATATIAAGGKRLRPLLVLVAAGPAAADEEALVRAGVAVELVHSATLVHDDVLDAAALRRGAATVWASAGREAATSTGDALFAAAFAELTAGGDLAQVAAVSRAASALAAGELMQRADAWNVDVSVERYLERCELKTGRLFEAACVLGNPALATFGLRIGLAFQLLDDVLDVSGPPERTGKPRGTDLLDGTVTLPLILARPQLGVDDLRSIQTPEQAAELCDRIAATGALDAARERALAMVAEAKAQLPADLPESQRAALELVADGVVARYA